MNNKLNLPPFCIGQKVVIKSGIGKGTKVKILNIAKSKPCGCFVCEIDLVGYTFKEGVAICECRNRCGLFGSGVYIDSYRLAPIQESPAPLLTFEQIKQTEKEEILILN